MAAVTETDSVATEHTEEPQLAELLNQEAGLTSEIELKVVHTQVIEYSYKANNGDQVTSQKVQVVLQSKIPEQYCLGVAKLQKQTGDKAELKKIQDRWQTGTTWKFKAIKLLNEKSPFIHITCRVTIDLRNSQVQALLQSTGFPEAPVPTITIADVLQLRQMQRFDLMAIPAGIIAERGSKTGMRIADVRLVDGSKQTSTTTECAYASLPLTLFFKNETELNLFKNNIGSTPMLFMCLSGTRKPDRVEVSTIKDQSWLQAAAGTKCATMAGEAAMMCGDHANLKDVATLQEFNASSSIDYTSPMATLTACRLVDPTCATPSSILGDATEHLYQLNHVYVIPPSKTDAIKTDDGRLFARLEVGITRRIPFWHFAARPCCTSLRLVTTSSSNMKSSLQTANFDIQSWRPYACKCKQRRKSPTLVQQSLAKHNLTISSQAWSSKQYRAHSIISLTIRCKPYMGC